MTARIIDGKALAREVEAQARARSEALASRPGGRRPGLAVVLVGEDPASCVYVKNKTRACERAGVISTEYRLSADTTEKELLELIEKLNNDPAVDGILVQLPLPKQINPDAVILSISPEKDVDGFHMLSAGALLTGRRDRGYRPCTPAGVMKLIEASGVNPEGLEAVVIGRSNIVGKPMSMLLLHRHGTVTICHSRTQDLAEVCRRADILVAAVGKAGFITPDMVKEGAVVIDVGINRNAEGKVCGDVAPEVMEKASYMTPVPGGAGPMTITMLMKNTLKAAKLQNGIR